MNHYQRDIYHIHLFDKHGTKQKTLTASNYQAAVALGQQHTQQPPHASFAVTQ